MVGDGGRTTKNWILSLFDQWRPRNATVTDVQPGGVELHVEGEESPRPHLYIPSVDGLTIGDSGVLHPMKGVGAGQFVATGVAGIAATIDLRLNDVESELADTQTGVSLLRYNQFDPADPQYGGIRGEVSAPQRIINRNAIEMAADDARDAGGTLIIRGTFEVNDGVTFNCHVDGQSGEIHVYNTAVNPGVLLGSTVPGSTPRGLQVLLPKVILKPQKTVGAAWTSTVGVECANLNECNVTFQEIRDFGENVKFAGYAQGNAYNTYAIGILNNGKINMHLSPQAGGWVNENVFIGGRYSHYTGEGTNVAGVNHILVDQADNSVNNNVWIKPSIEGNVPEYHVNAAGAYNRIIQGRWEASTPKLRWFGTAHSWDIDGGYNLQWLQVSAEAGAGLYCRVHSPRLGMLWDGEGGANGLIRLTARSSSNDPVINVYRAAGNFWSRAWATAWQWSLSSTALRGKAEADAYARLKLTPENGRVLFGDGTYDPVAGFGPYASDAIRVLGGMRLFMTGQWDNSPLQMNTYYLWVDSAGKLRIKNGAPTSDTDGVVVGTQS